MSDAGVVPTRKPFDDRCRCDFDYRSLGKLHGINMGKGWVRITTHPKCPVHSLCRHFTKQVRAEASNGRYLYCNVHATKDCPR